jgi:2-polyprenyl-3-methyl-5-hydroxy-6-metoxy-1,4-benzoquinol methylase
LAAEPVLPASDWPSEGLEPVTACPVCGSASHEVMHTGLTDNTFFAAPGRWTMKGCVQCGTGYLDPRPTADSIGGAYASYYTHSGGQASGGRGLKATIKQALKQVSETYIESLAAAPGARRSLRDRLLIGLVKLAPAYRELIDAEHRHLRRPEPGADRLLDIGCGGGEFLQRARRLGWSVEGVDFDPKAVAAASAAGLKVSVGSIEAYAEVRNHFDVVTCNHVIEHVYDARELVEAIYRILKPGGRIWIETPNIGSAGHALFGKSWRGLEAPRHLAILDYPMLRKLLVDAGFVITHHTPWNIQHIRAMFAMGEAIESGGDPNNTHVPLLPNKRLRQGLVQETLRVERREFVCLRGIKPA